MPVVISSPKYFFRSMIVLSLAESSCVTHMILQGTKDNLGGTGTISKTSGKLTLTGSDGDPRHGRLRNLHTNEMRVGRRGLECHRRG